MIISFDKRYYNLPAIEAAIKAYQGLAIFNLKKDKSHILVEADKVDEEIKDVFEDEFCNFVLSEVKNKI